MSGRRLVGTQIFSAPILGTLVGFDDIEESETTGGHAGEKHRVRIDVGGHHAKLDEALPNVADGQARDLALHALLAGLGSVEHEVECPVDPVAVFQVSTPLVGVDGRPRIFQMRNGRRRCRRRCHDDDERSFSIYMRIIIFLNCTLQSLASCSYHLLHNWNLQK